MNSKTLLLAIAALLIGIGILKPNFSNIIGPTPVVNPVVDVDVSKPTDPVLLEKCNDVVKALAENNDRKTDGKRLASLYIDLATLIDLDGSDEVVKTTEEIRQANRLSGIMLQLNIKDKYSNLAEAAQSVIVSAIGDDDTLLDKKLRDQASSAFRALAWACKEGSK